MDDRSLMTRALDKGLVNLALRDKRLGSLVALGQDMILLLADFEPGQDMILLLADFQQERDRHQVCHDLTLPVEQASLWQSEWLADQMAY